MAKQTSEDQTSGTRPASQFEVSRRRFLTLSGGVAGGLLLAACTSEGVVTTLTTLGGSGTGSTTGSGGTAAGGGPKTIADLMAGLPDPTGPIVLLDGTQRTSDNPTGTPSSYMERPEFADAVAQGTLPPVAERIGMDPLVISPVHEIGKYGGPPIERPNLTVDNWDIAVSFNSGRDGLFAWDTFKQEIVPNVAKGFEFNSDFTEMTIHLRQGMRWSDGTPFTADDLVFWRESMDLNPDLKDPEPELAIDGVDGELIRIDDYTVVYKFAGPNPLLPTAFAGISNLGGQAWAGSFGGGGYAPKHYLSQFMPEFVGQAAADKAAADAGFENWQAHVFAKNFTAENIDLPVVMPWILTRSIKEPPWEYTANPYSIWVDTDGNQLPYIKDIRFTDAGTADVVTLRQMSGEYTVSDQLNTISDLPILLENQEAGDYKVTLNPGQNFDFGLRINLAHNLGTGQGDAIVGDLLRTADFRRALSLGVQRDQVNEAFFLNTATPTSLAPADTSIYALEPEWRTRWATYDPEQANSLLDGLGLTERDGEGYRLRPDGSGRIVLENTTNNDFQPYTDMSSMVADHWRDIGIYMDVRETPNDLSDAQDVDATSQLHGLSVGSDDVFLFAGNFLPLFTSGPYSIPGAPFAEWFNTGGTSGAEPPRDLKLHDAMKLLADGRKVGMEERIEKGKEIYRLAVDQVWAIAVVGFGVTSGINTFKTKLGNMPERYVFTDHQLSPGNTLPQTYYWTDV